ncbi:MAG: hypothetical protein HC805_06670, partial [Alkalinema sp. RL_2_19]|nr:hypothetical protein [Alkalinema sp. RL_2_19]
PIPQRTEFIANSVSFAQDMRGGVTYSIDQGKTFSDRPMIQVKGKSVPAPAASYTHLRIRLKQAINPQSAVSAHYQVRVQ